MDAAGGGDMTTRTKRTKQLLGRPITGQPLSSTDEPRYVMSVAARLANMPPQTIRACERAGLLTPARPSGRQRLYSERDLKRLGRIKTLMADMGVNLAGVEVALRLMDRITELEQQLRKA